MKRGAFLLALALALTAAGDPLNPRLEEVLASLDRSRPELRPVFAAPTPEKRQAALLAAFKARAPMGDPPPKFTAEARRVADNALKHIFIGQPAYPPQPRGTPIDWDTNPFPDREWILQFHRFTWLPSLAAAWRETADERYAQEWAGEINAWVEHMHTPERMKSHPGWRDLEVASRMLTWGKTFEAFLNSPACDGFTLVNFLYSLKIHGDRMAALFPGGRLPENCGNWQVYELEGLLVVAALFPEYRAREAWAALAIDCIGRIQSRVMLPDGVINEYIPSYHMAYPAQFLQFQRLCDRYNFKTSFPSDYRDRIARSVTAVVLWCHPDGTAPVFGDAWLRDCRGWVGQFLREFPDRDDWRWFATAGREGKAPALRNYDLPDAGYYMLRTGWGPDDLFVVLKNTQPISSMWHNQEDNLTFEFSAYGERLMTDSGCYNYSGEPEWRKWFRSPLAHQLISIDNKEIQSDRARMVARDSSPLAEVLVVENHPYPELLHRRTVILLDKRYLLLLDEVSGKETGSLRQHFQFEPGAWKCDPATLSARTERPDRVNLLVLGASGGPPVKLEEEEGWISYRYMVKEKRPAFAFVREKKDDKKVVFLTVLLPAPKGEAFATPELGFTRNGRPVSAYAGEWSFSPGNGDRYRFTIDAKSALPRIRKTPRR